MSVASVTRNTVATQTVSFEELVEQAMQERLRERQSAAERTLEELRPLCEEVPDCVCDPITYEALSSSATYGCGHSFSVSTVGDIAKAEKLTKKDLFVCPVCRQRYPITSFYSSIAIDQSTEQFQKISRVFKRYVV